MRRLCVNKLQLHAGHINAKCKWTWCTRIYLYTYIHMCVHTYMRIYIYIYIEMQLKRRHRPKSNCDRRRVEGFKSTDSLPMPSNHSWLHFSGSYGPPVALCLCVFLVKSDKMQLQCAIQVSCIPCRGSRTQTQTKTKNKT